MSRSTKGDSEYRDDQSTVIRCRRFPVDFGDLGRLSEQESARIVREKRPGVWYLNPVCEVFAEEDGPKFRKVVMKRQAEWFRLLSRQFKSQWRKVREQCSAMQRAYEFDGVVIVEGARLPFDTWKLVFWKPADGGG